MKQKLLLLLIACSLAGCESLGLKSKNWTHQVSDVGKTAYFVIENDSQPAFVRFTIEGELSHDAKILWSDLPPDADSVFVNPREILLPEGKIDMKDIREDYYSRKLYVKYVSLNDSTSGNLRIRIRI